MAVVSCNPMFRSPEGSEDEDGVRKYNMSYLLLTDDASDGPARVLAYGGLPQRGQSYAFGSDADLGAYCKNRSAKQPDDSPYKWVVDIEWASDGKPENEAAADNPLEEPTKYTLSFSKYSKPITVDINGDPIWNTAKVPLDPPIEVDDSRPVLRITRNEPPNFPVLAARAIAYQDKLNSDTFFGATAGQAKINAIEVSSEFKKNDVSYCTVSYEIEFRRETWKIKNVSKGLCELYEVTTGVFDFRKILGGDKKPITEPVLLDVDGKKTITPYTQEFDVYQSTAFSGLGL